MSFLGNIFKKKDDFSFDDKEFSAPLGGEDPFATPNSAAPQTGSDPFTSTSPDAFSMQNSEQPFSATGNDIDPFATSANPMSVPNTTGMPPQSNIPSSNPMPPMPNPNDIAPTRGSQIAQDYIKKQQASALPHTQTNEHVPTNTQSNSLEMINLKLDAIKSQLETLNQRMQKLEHEPKNRW